MDYAKRQLMEHRLGAIAKIAAMSLFLCVSLAWLTQSNRNAALKVRVETAQLDLDREQRDGGELQQRLQGKDERVRAVARAVAGELDRRNKLLVTMSDILKRVDRLWQQKERFQHRRDQIAQELRRMEEHYLRAKQQTTNNRP